MLSTLPRGCPVTIGPHSLRHWWLAAPLLVLGLLAHDGLMASVAYAAPGVAEATDARGHQAAHEAIGRADTASDDAAPEHPSECGTAGTAVVSPGSEPERGHVALPALFVAERFTVPESTFGDGWREPCWPPGVRRALLQVYRN